MDYRDLEQNIGSDHFWFRGKRGLIRILLEKAGLPRGASILNLGAGTGDDLEVMGAFGRIHAVDCEQAALDSIDPLLVAEKLLCDATRLPYPDASFDAAVAFDLLEHMEDDAAAVNEIARVLKPGGAFVFTVPAFGFLFSAHDRQLGHLRRYTKGMLRELLAPWFERFEMGYWMSTLFPFIASARIMEKKRGKASSSAGPLNGLFSLALSMENRLIALGIKMPVGSTIYGVFRRKA